MRFRDYFSQKHPCEPFDRDSIEFSKEAYTALCDWPDKELDSVFIDELISKIDGKYWESYQTLINCPPNRLNEDQLNIMANGVEDGRYRQFDVLKNAPLENLTAYSFSKFACRVSCGNGLGHHFDTLPSKTMACYEVFIDRSISSKDAYSKASKFSDAQFNLVKDIIFKRIAKDPEYSDIARRKLPKKRREEFLNYIGPENIGRLTLANDNEGGELAIAQNLEGALSEVKDASEANETYVSKDAYGLVGGEFQ
jgi:hypothetical protein